MACLLKLRSQAGPVGGREAGREVLNRPVEQAGGRVGAGFGQGAQLVHHLGHQGFGQRHAGFHALAEVGNSRLRPGREAPNPAQPVVIVRYRFKGLRARARPKLGQVSGQAVELVKGNHPVVKREAFQALIERISQDVVAGLIRRAEAGAVKLLQPREVALVEFSYAEYLGRMAGLTGPTSRFWKRTECHLLGLLGPVRRPRRPALLLRRTLQRDCGPTLGYLRRGCLCGVSGANRARNPGVD